MNWLERKILISKAKSWGKEHKEMLKDLPPWALNLIQLVFSVGSPYIAVKYPEYLPVIIALSGALGITVQNVGNKQVPKEVK